MHLFERSATYRPKLTGWRDTTARFIHDLATNGIPMSLESLKAASDAAAADQRLRAPSNPAARSFRLIQSIGALVGAPQASRA